MTTALILNEHAKKLLEAISAGDGKAVDRKFIADYFGRASLNGADFMVLEIMALNGVIEEIEQDTKAPSGIKKLYRLPV